MESDRFSSNSSRRKIPLLSGTVSECLLLSDPETENSLLRYVNNLHRFVEKAEPLAVAERHLDTFVRKNEMIFVEHEQFSLFLSDACKTQQI